MVFLLLPLVLVPYRSFWCFPGGTMPPFRIGCGKDAFLQRVSHRIVTRRVISGD